MKKLIVFIGFLLIIAVGCSSDITTNPTSPQDNSSKNKTLAKENSANKLTFEKVIPLAKNFMEEKIREYGIAKNLKLKPAKSKVVDITKIPGIVIPTIRDIEKLYTGNGKYFSGHNLMQPESLNSVILDYYSWSVPYPEPSKPFFEYMGSGQTSNYTMDEMEVWSIHYLNNDYLDVIENYDQYCPALSVSHWHEQAEEPYWWQVVGAHYFYRWDFPYIEFLDYSYAEDRTDI